MDVPYVNLVAQHRALKDELLEAVGRVFDHGQFVLGPEVEEFERRFAQWCGVGHAVAVSSGTDALVLALRGLQIGPGDEVLTVPNSYIASTSCIALVGARPVFVDVGEDYNIDSTQIEAAVTPRTKAILPVHLTGRPADMDAINNVAQRHGLKVVEDAAQAVQAEYQSQPVGSLGDVAAFSLHPLKTLNACGDGGVLTTNDALLAEELRRLHNHGLENRGRCVGWGVNSRLDSLQAAMLLIKLDHLEAWTAARRRHAAYYQQRLADLPEVSVPIDRPQHRAVYHTFVIMVQRRDELRRFLADRGIGTAVHYPVPIHLQPAARPLGYSTESFPVAEQQARCILSLPVYPELDDTQLQYVVDAIREFYQR